MNFQSKLTFGIVFLAGLSAVRAVGWCNPANTMCVTAEPAGNVVNYSLQSTAGEAGWMAIGFGSTMANSPMILVWNDGAGGLTVSERSAPARVMPTVVPDAQRLGAQANLASSDLLSSRPTLSFTLPVTARPNLLTAQQDMIWAYSTVRPQGGPDAIITKHTSAGRFTLNLAENAASPSQSGSPPQQTGGNQQPARRGDRFCGRTMCVDAVVQPDNTVLYTLASTSAADQTGYMAVGWGTTMANSPMVILWSDGNGGVTLSQRLARSRTQPLVQTNLAPSATATLRMESSNVTGNPAYSFSMPAPPTGQTRMDMIWAFSPDLPESSPDASLTQHTGRGTFSLDLSKTIGSNAPVDTTRGDRFCSNSMCVEASMASPNATSITYTLSSKSALDSTGWLAIGFGSGMINSRMIIVWPNSDGTVTISQRTTRAYVMPTVDNAPPARATLLQARTNLQAANPQISFTLPTSAVQNLGSVPMIYGFSSRRPTSSAVTANIAQHDSFGSFTMNLTKPLNSSGGSGPLTPRQIRLLVHATLCSVGFLVLLPFGAILARWFRTFTTAWFKAHWIVQWIFAGLTITVGVILGVVCVQEAGTGHFMTTHQRLGFIIFLLYILQCCLGALIHFYKPQGGIFGYAKRRPPQNYLHAVLGISIIGLSFYQVRNGFETEWTRATGQSFSGALLPLWTGWVIVVPILYLAGMALIARQYRQERESREAKLKARKESFYV